MKTKHSFYLKFVSTVLVFAFSLSTSFAYPDIPQTLICHSEAEGRRISGSKILRRVFETAQDGKKTPNDKTRTEAYASSFGRRSELRQLLGLQLEREILPPQPKARVIDLSVPPARAELRSEAAALETTLPNDQIILSEDGLVYRKNESGQLQLVPMMSKSDAILRIDEMIKEKLTSATAPVIIRIVGYPGSRKTTMSRMLRDFQIGNLSENEIAVIESDSYSPKIELGEDQEFIYDEDNQRHDFTYHLLWSDFFHFKRFRTDFEKALRSKRLIIVEGHFGDFLSFRAFGKSIEADIQVLLHAPKPLRTKLVLKRDGHDAAIRDEEHLFRPYVLRYNQNVGRDLIINTSEESWPLVLMMNGNGNENGKNDVRSELRVNLHALWKRNHFIITAEQDDPNGIIQEVREKNLIDAVTIPDVAFYLRPFDIWNRFIRNKKKSNDALSLLQGSPNAIFTIAAGARSLNTIEKRILRAVELGTPGLLVLSGGGVSQRLGSVTKRMMNSSFDILELIKKMKREGRIPEDLPIYAVADPYQGTIQDSVDRLQAKIDAGAEMIFTQPPLVWNEFKLWWNEIERRGLSRRVPIIIGIPLIASSGNLQFWYQFLIRTGVKNDEAQELILKFQKAEEAGRESLTAFRREWAIDLIRKVRGLPNVAGIHLFPMKAKKDLEHVLNHVMQIDELIGELESFGVKVDFENSLKNEKNSAHFRRILLETLKVFHSLPKEDIPNHLQFDNIIYKQHAHKPVSVRRFSDSHDWEVGINLRAFPAEGFDPKQFRRNLRHALKVKSDSFDSVLIGETKSHSENPMGDFSHIFWQHVGPYTNTQGRDYRKSINDSPDSNPRFIRYNAERFLKRLRSVILSEAKNPAQFYYLEIGAASVDYAKQFITVLKELASPEELEYLTYVVADASDHILEAAVRELKTEQEGIQIEYANLNVASREAQLEKYRARTLAIHETNLVDTLPFDIIARKNGRYYEVKTRLFLSREELKRISEKYGLDASELESDLRKIPTTGVLEFLGHYREIFREADHNSQNGDWHFYHFWNDLYGSQDLPGTGLQVEEYYEEINDLSRFDFLTTVPRSGILLKEILDTLQGDFRMPLSNLAIDSILILSELLHEKGALEITDISVNQVDGFKTHPYRGKFAKYDGSAVTWFNGWLLGEVLKRAKPGHRTQTESLKEFGKPQMSLITIDQAKVPVEAATRSELRLFNSLQISGEGNASLETQIAQINAKIEALMINNPSARAELRKIFLSHDALPQGLIGMAFNRHDAFEVLTPAVFIQLANLGIPVAIISPTTKEMDWIQITNLDREKKGLLPLLAASNYEEAAEELEKQRSEYTMFVTTQRTQIEAAELAFNFVEFLSENRLRAWVNTVPGLVEGLQEAHAIYESLHQFA